jgi:NAD(P) transhydrogenase subunit alpha
MYSNNLFNLVDEYWDAEQKHFALDLDDDILSGCLITHAGEIVNPTIKAHYA